MSVFLTPKQTLLLWTLLGGGGQAERKALKPAADGDALFAAGLLTTGYKTGKAPWVEVTDRGWAWAGEHLGDELPKANAALRTWLGRIKTYLDASGTPLAELFTPAPEPLSPQPAKAPKPPPKPRGAATPKAPKVSKPPTAEQMRRKIVRAYGEVTGKKKGQRVLLSELRAKLPDIERTTLDASLHDLQENGDAKIRLLRLDDPREISPDIREAALMFKDEPLHLIWIDR